MEFLSLCFSGIFKVRSDCQNYNTLTSKELSAPITITTRSKFPFIYRLKNNIIEIIRQLMT